MIFTPRTQDGKRLKIDIEEGSMIPRGYVWRRTFVEKKTGKQYVCRGASCGLPRCMCDAVVIKILPKEKK
jgi:hypothetical protein